MQSPVVAACFALVAESMWLYSSARAMKYRKRKRWTFDSAARFASGEIRKRPLPVLAGATRLLSWAAARLARAAAGV